MPSENVEIVLALVDAFRRRDGESGFALYDPDIEWDASRMDTMVPDVAGVYRGHDGVREFWQRWLSAWKDLQFDVQDVLEAGDEAVLLIHNQRQWGRLSGITTKVEPYAIVFTIRAGKVVRTRVYADQGEALAAAGLAG